VRAIEQTDNSGPLLVHDRAEPKIAEPRDAIVRVTMSAAGTLDLLFAGSRDHGVLPGTVLGHQAVGEVVAVGDEVNAIAVGQRVLVSPIVACGSCAYCKVGFFAQCVEVNPGDGGFGGVYLGGPSIKAPIDGVHADLVRIPYADMGLVALPDRVSDELALLMTEMYPLGFFAAKLSLICAGDRVGVFGADPAGVMATATAIMLGAGQVVVVDDDGTRLTNAKSLGATPIKAAAADAADAVRDHLNGRGVQCAILTAGAGLDERETGLSGQILRAAVEALTRDSTIAVAGVYPPTYRDFPLASATRKYVTIKAAACNYTKYLGPLLNLLNSGLLSDTVLTDVDALAERVAPEDLFDAAHTARTRWVLARWS
jgi:threonine dehydrogenase-like Zn-dependent dehydrogenase